MPSLVEPVVDPELVTRAPQPSLDAGTVLLRPWAETDVAAVVAAYEEPAIRHWHSRSMTADEARRWIDDAQHAWERGTAASWAVEAGGVLVGRMTLKLRLDQGQAEAAYWTREQARGRGFAVDALRTCTGWAFEVGLHRVELEHSVTNPASCRVATKAGFAAEGTRAGAVLHADGWHDMHLHGRVAPAPPAPARGDDAGRREATDRGV